MPAVNGFGTFPDVICKSSAARSKPQHLSYSQIILSEGNVVGNMRLFGSNKTENYREDHNHKGGLDKVLRVNIL